MFLQILTKGVFGALETNGTCVYMCRNNQIFNGKTRRKNPAPSGAPAAATPARRVQGDPAGRKGWEWRSGRRGKVSCLEEHLLTFKILQIFVFFYILNINIIQYLAH